MLIPRPSPLWSLALAVSLGLVTGCPGDASEDDGANGTAGTAMADTEMADSGASGSGAMAPFDEDEVIALAGMYATALDQINDQPASSQHGLADTVNVYVDPTNADLYRMLDPAAPSELAFPEGTLIVKEHLDAGGAPDGYLLMYRGPEGYSPEGVGWFWARVDGAGTTRDAGAVGYCVSCHAAVPGHVFGVPLDNRR